MKIQSLLNKILNRSNYSYIINFLIGLTLLFLFLGNYNLVFKEGLTSEEEIKKFTDARDAVEKESDKTKDLNNHYKKEELRRRNNEHLGFSGKLEEDDVVEGFDECASNFSNIGVDGNNANLMVNSQCETIRTLKNKNKSVLKETHKNVK